MNPLDKYFQLARSSILSEHELLEMASIIESISDDEDLFSIVMAYECLLEQENNFLKEDDPQVYFKERARMNRGMERDLQRFKNDGFALRGFVVEGFRQTNNVTNRQIAWCAIQP